MDSVPNLPGVTEWLQLLLHHWSSTEVARRDAAQKCGPTTSRFSQLDGGVAHVWPPHVPVSSRLPLPLEVSWFFKMSLVVFFLRLITSFTSSKVPTLSQTGWTHTGSHCGETEPQPLATRDLVSGLLKINLKRCFDCSFRSLSKCLAKFWDHQQKLT